MELKEYALIVPRIAVANVTESIQWNWKNILSKRKDMARHPGIHSMELKGLGESAPRGACYN